MKYVLGVVILLLLVILILGLRSSQKDYTAFATCLTEKGYVMAGTDWCPHCKDQKAMFNGAFEDIIIPAGAYINCEASKQTCRDLGVTGYPTWVTPEENLLPGTRKLSELAQLSGCSLS